MKQLEQTKYSEASDYGKFCAALQGKGIRSTRALCGDIAGEIIVDSFFTGKTWKHFIAGRNTRDTGWEIYAQPGEANERGEKE